MLELFRDVPDIAKEANRKILGCDRLRSEHLLRSATSSCHYYGTPEAQISSVVRGIIKNHPFVDANKRAAVIVLYVLAGRLGLTIPRSDDDMFQIIVNIAAFNPEVEQIAAAIFGD